MAGEPIFFSFQNINLVNSDKHIVLFLHGINRRGAKNKKIAVEIQVIWLIQNILRSL